MPAVELIVSNPLVRSKLPLSEVASIKLVVIESLLIALFIESTITVLSSPNMEPLISAVRLSPNVILNPVTVAPEKFMFPLNRITS